MIVVERYSADCDIEVRILDNNPPGLERAEIERVVRNQYNRLLRQKEDSKALSASKVTTTAQRGDKKRRPRNRFEGSCLYCGREGHCADNCRRAKKKTKIRRYCRRQERRR